MSNAGNALLKDINKNVPGYVCNHGSTRERHQRCPALNHMCNQSKLMTRRQVRVTS